MKSSCHVLFVFMLCQYLKFNEAQIVFLYKHSGMSGDSIRVRLDQCRNLPDDWNRHVSSIDTMDNCARLFSGMNCQGSFIEILPNSPSTRELSTWRFQDTTRSISYCRNACSQDVTGILPQHSFHVQVYRHQHFEGSSRNISVNGCTPIPENYNEQIKSVKTNGHCIQFYDNNNCDTGSNFFDRKSIELRVGTPFHNEFDKWNFQRARAVSHCAYKCNSRSYYMPASQCLTMKTHRTLTSSKVSTNLTYVAAELAKKLELHKILY